MAITAPVDGTSVTAGTALTVKATVTDWDGGVWPGTGVPTSASAGVTIPTLGTLTKSGNIFTGAFGLPSDAGSSTVTVGWAGVDASVTVNRLACDRSCSEWEECQPTVDGGQCNDLQLTLAWTKPADNSLVVGKNTTVPLALIVTRPDGGGFVKPVPFTMDGTSAGSLMPDGGDWEASVDGGATTTTRTLVAGWPAGGPSKPTRTFNVDATPPTLTLTPVGTPPFQRDATVYAVLSGSETLTAGSVTVGGVTMSSTTTDKCTNFGSVSNAYACYALDMSAPALTKLTDSFAVTLGGTDKYANAGSGATTIDVTRVRWQVSVGTQDAVDTLAIAPDGKLFVGTVNVATTSGKLVGLSPTTGAVVVPAVTVGEVQSIAIAGALVYAAYNSSLGTIGAFNRSDLSAAALPACAATGFTYSGIAIWDGGTGLGATAIGSVNTKVSNDGKGCLYSSVSGGIPFNFASSGLDAYPSSGTYTPSNVVISGGTASFLTKPAGGAPNWQPVTLASSPTLGTARPLAGGSSTFAQGQSVVAGAFLIGTPDNGNSKELFLADSGVPVSGNLGADADTGVPAIASVTEAYVGRGGDIVKFNPGFLNDSTHSLTVWSASSGGAVRTSPVLGKAASGATWGYAVTGAGELAAFRMDAPASWRASSIVGSGGTVLAHPTLDCNRGGNNKTGVLYVGGQNGNVVAIVVDSPGLLDTAGAWPKYQRTAGNAGNDDTTFPTNWPGCP